MTLAVRRATLITLAALAAVGMSSTVSAQSPDPRGSGGQNPDTSASRPATTTVRGDTGLWFVPTAEVMPAKKWSFSLSRLEGDDGQGFSNISNFPLSVGWGLTNHVELFGSWNVITRVDRDTVPLFFSASSPSGTGGGLLVDYPFVRSTWIGTNRGDLWLGAKINLLSQADQKPLAIAFRAMFKLPTGGSATGASSGKADWALDAIVSREIARTLEMSGYGGLRVRGEPDGYTLTNGFQWGFGTGFPSRSALRVTAELYGEAYSHNMITAPAGLFGDDGSPVPTMTTIKSPAYFNLGVTYQFKNGFFLGIGGNWNLTMAPRQDAGNYPNELRRAADYQVRLGFHPGARKYVPPPPPPPPAPAPAPTPTPPAPVNHPPTVHATCAPCTVEIGKTSTVSADAQDADGDALTYQWRTNTGTLASPASRQSVWTAPTQVGPVPVTVVVDDGKGGTASDAVTIQVVAPAVKTYEFEDVHFDFDRYTLQPAALRILDEAVAAMQADPTLSLVIEGHTCDIGTAEYNLALGERRANAVSQYFQGRGIASTRLKTISYGEESPKYDNSREETRRLNRRAALVVSLQRN